MDEKDGEVVLCFYNGFNATTLGDWQKAIEVEKHNQMARKMQELAKRFPDAFKDMI